MNVTTPPSARDAFVPALAMLLALTSCHHHARDAAPEPSVERPDVQDVHEIQRLDASAGVTMDYLGSSVAVSGRRALVGAPRTFDSFGQVSSAYVFRWDDSHWVEEQRLTAASGELDDRFGSSVCLDGKRALVGAPRSDYRSQGAVHAFHHDGNRWVQAQELTASDGCAGNGFGRSVSCRGDRAVIGAPNQRSAYLFRYQDDHWVEEQKLQKSRWAADDFGFSVSVDGDRVLIGAIEDQDWFPAHGAAYVFRYDGTVWVEEQRLTAKHGGRGDRFGLSVSLSGDVALIGAPEASSRHGSAYWFRLTDGRWVEEQEVAGGSTYAFGSSVSVLGDRALVGADDRLGERTQAGSVSMFRFDGKRWVLERRLTASDGRHGDHLGDSVALGESFALVGAPNHHVTYPAGSDQCRGAAYVFR